jgi:hypothetical protein
MAKPKGSKKIGGRTKGTPNKLTASIKEAFAITFTILQDDKKANLEAWAKENPTEFYKIMSKVIPTELQVDGDLTIKKWSVVITDGNKN